MQSKYLSALISVKAFLRRPDGRILLVQDAGNTDLHAHIKGMWDALGGKMDAEEDDMKDGLVREVMEEGRLNITPYLDSLKLVDAHVFRHWKGVDICIHYYEVRVEQDTEVVLSEEHSAAKWVTIQEALAMDLTPATHVAIKAYAVL